MLVLSQLSRAPDTRPGDHRPQLSDLRESGSIEQDADVVAFIFREEVYKQEREDLRGQAELMLTKQRNGPTGKIDLVFLHHLTKFENRAGDLGMRRHRMAKRKAGAAGLETRARQGSLKVFDRGNESVLQCHFGLPAEFFPG